MSSILEDPTQSAHPPPKSPPPFLTPLHVTLSTGEEAIILPSVQHPQQSPQCLAQLHQEFTWEVERGTTYPMDQAMDLAAFTAYWFGGFAGVCVDKSGTILGTFYIKPNYPGRCSHICNGGFLTCTEARGKGVGRAMATAFLHYGPLLGYRYSVFNLVFETNAASLHLWDSLGFQRIGRVKGAGLLRDQGYVDAIIFGRDLI